MESFISYSPILIVVVYFLIQLKLFPRSEEVNFKISQTKSELFNKMDRNIEDVSNKHTFILTTIEKKHREILEDARNEFAPLSIVNDLQKRFDRLENKLDQIISAISNKHSG